jgi:hypothetical protein
MVLCQTPFRARSGSPFVVLAACNRFALLTVGSGGAQSQADLAIFSDFYRSAQLVKHALYRGRGLPIFE